MADNIENLLALIEQNTHGVPDFNTEFLVNLRAIEEHTKAITSLIPEQTADLTRTMVDVYQNAGAPSRGTEAPHSTSGRRSGSSSLDSGDVEKLADALRSVLASGSGASGGGPGGEGRNLPQSWRDRASLPPTDTSVGWLHFPGTKPSPQDYLDMMSVFSAKWAQRQQTGIDAKHEAEQQALYDKLLNQHGGDPNRLTQDDLDQLSALPPDSRFGKVSDTFSSLKRGYMTGRVISGMVKDIAKPFSNATEYAYQTGYQGTAGPSGPLGLRLPWNDATMSGFGQRLSEIGFAFNNDVSPGQAKTIYDQLFSHGWYGGPSTDAMRTAAAHIMKRNPMIGNMSETYDMMDRATRQGATSLNNFVDTMDKIPDAAHAAKTSIADTMSQMDALGMYNTQIGGNYISGLKNAVDWQRTTGQPAAFMQQLMQNPMVIGQTFAATGLMPQMQGLASPYQHMQGIMGALNLMNRTMVTPGNHNFKDPITGLTQTITGQDQKEALMSSMFGVPKDVIHTMLANQKGWMTGAAIQNSAEMYTQSVVNASRTHQGAYVVNSQAWKRLQAALPKAVDAQGHHIFEDWDYYNKMRHPHAAGGLGGILGSLGFVDAGMSQAQAHKAAQKHALSEIQHAGDRYQGHWELGFKGGKWISGDPVKAAQARQKAIEHYEQMNTQKFGSGSQGNNGPSLKIELGPAAKKMFHLTDPNNQQKASLNAGSASVNLNSYVNGPTATPYPNLDTAGSSTYQYGTDPNSQ